MKNEIRLSLESQGKWRTDWIRTNDAQGLRSKVYSNMGSTCNSFSAKRLKTLLHRSAYLINTVPWLAVPTPWSWTGKNWE